MLCVGPCAAQKGTAEPDFYPIGYTLDTWTGEVSAFDNQARTLTLTYGSGPKAKTFVATIPEAPYEWGRDGQNFRVLDFPFDKKASAQVFKLVMRSGAYRLPPGQEMAGTPFQKRPNPPAENVIGDFSQFLNHTITVYYMTRERTVDGKKEQYNDVWRIRVLSKSK
jgi:hypothetical protein